MPATPIGSTSRTWKRIITYYRRAFPHTPINLDIVEPWGAGGSSNVVDPVVRFATRRDRKKAWIQSNALRARHARLGGALP